MRIIHDNYFLIRENGRVHLEITMCVRKLQHILF